MSGVTLLIDGANGIYVPKIFSTRFDLDEWGINVPDQLELQDIDNLYYWDTWHDVLTNAKYIDKDGHVWTLWQDGDLWAVCEELLTEEERENFGWNE